MTSTRHSSVVRKIECEVSANDLKPLYLTFDDGPDPDSTPEVLDALQERGMKATFFVVAEHARKTPALLARIVNEGHAIGNHSLDHTYRRLFRGKAALKGWVEDAEKILGDLIGKPTIGFRPPNGILTPELKRALNELQMPIVYWNVRFYDTLFAWTEKKALRSLDKTEAGSIVLLHDRQNQDKLPLFLRTFSVYSKHLQQAGFQCRALNRDLIERNALKSGTQTSSDNNESPGY